MRLEEMHIYLEYKFSIIHVDTFSLMPAQKERKDHTSVSSWMQYSAKFWCVLNRNKPPFSQFVLHGCTCMRNRQLHSNNVM